MIFWFIGGSIVAVWVVLRDPKIDYRLVAAGALLPDIVDGVLGGARAMHTLVASGFILAAAMGGTVGNREVRKRALAVPFGTLLHLVLDSIWTWTDLFWWPFFGVSFGGAGLPSFERPVGIVIAQEVAGILMLVAWGRAVGLGDPKRRQGFVRTGRLDDEEPPDPPRRPARLG